MPSLARQLPQQKVASVYGQEAAAASGELHMDGGRGVEELLDGVAPNGLGTTAARVRVSWTASCPQKHSPKAASSARMHDGRGQCSRGKQQETLAARQWRRPTATLLLDGMASGGRGYSQQGTLSMFGENGGSGIP